MGGDRRWAVAGALVVFVALVVAALGAAATYSPLFDATTIEVVGSSRPRARIVGASGLAQGVNVYHLDTEAAEQALLGDPWIVSATVRRELPATIVIEVEERVAVVVAGGSAIAADGVILPGAAPKDLPSVRSSVGDLDPDQTGWAAVAAASLDPAVRERVRYIVVGLDGTLRLSLDGGLGVRWGTTGEDAEKAAALRALLELHDGGRAMTSIDVSVPASPGSRFA